MTPLKVVMELDVDTWASHVPTLEAIDAEMIEVGVLPDATSSGAPAVGVLVRLKDGRKLIAWTTWALLYSAARAFEERYGAPE